MTSCGRHPCQTPTAASNHQWPSTTITKSSTTINNRDQPAQSSRTLNHPSQTLINHHKDLIIREDPSTTEGSFHRISPDCIQISKHSLNTIKWFHFARVEYPFPHLWHLKVVRNVWMGSAMGLHTRACLLLHLNHLCIWRQPSALWALLESVQAQKDAPQRMGRSKNVVAIMCSPSQ